MTETVLTVDAVTVAFPRPEGGDFHAVDSVSLQLARGETLGIVGESGSGKTMLALSLMGLVPKPGAVMAGRIDLLGREVTGLAENQLRHCRGRDIGMIFQDPMTSLNPVRRVGALLVEAIRRHGSVSRGTARERALEAFREVGIPSPEQRLDAYPHELSGGLRQRVMIALALVNRPAVIVADEPTTALDTTIQAQILALMRVRLNDAALILITHDLGVAAEICDRIAVMYHGRMVEMGPVADILAEPAHPYTAGLLAAVPRFDFDRPDLEPIPGAPPGPEYRLSGCAFRPRCGHDTDPCAETPGLEARGQRRVACFNPLTAGGAGD